MKRTNPTGVARVTPTEHMDMVLDQWKRGRLPDACVEWPAPKEGWSLNVPGLRAPYLMAYVLQLTVGHCRDDKGLVAHSCGNSACVHPGHLSWETRMAAEFATGFVARSVTDLRHDLK